MQRLIPSLAARAFAALPAGMASAHAVWLEIQHGALVVVYGHGAEDDAYDPAKLTALDLCDTAGSRAPLS